MKATNQCFITQRSLIFKDMDFAEQLYMAAYKKAKELLTKIFLILSKDQNLVLFAYRNTPVLTHLPHHAFHCRLFVMSDANLQVAPHKSLLHPTSQFTTHHATHTATFAHHEGILGRPDTQTDGTNSITSTTDTRSNNT